MGSVNISHSPGDKIFRCFCYLENQRSSLLKMCIPIRNTNFIIAVCFEVHLVSMINPSYEKNQFVPAEDLNLSKPNLSCSLVFSLKICEQQTSSLSQTEENVPLEAEELLDGNS